VTRTLLARTWLTVTALATLGLLIGILLAYVFTDRSERYTAQATLAMIPGPEVPFDDASNYWDVLNRGQATRSAALVLEDIRWLDAAATAAGVPKRELALSSGAIPETTLINVTMKADSARAAERALDSVLTDADGLAAKASGPFRLETIASSDGSATSLSPKPIQTVGALGIAGLLLGAGAGLLISRSAHEWSARRACMESRQKHSRVTSPLADPDKVIKNGAEQPSVKIPMR
jgi:hypothetical protein